MTVICRLLRLTPDTAAGLAAGRVSLADAQATSRDTSDVYRYWDGIAHLLQQHAPDALPLRWREAGRALASDAEDLPSPRLLDAAAVQALAAAIADLEPEALVPYYDAAALDAAGVYPGCWVAWEETFDPLGQLLEHYHFLRMFTSAAAAAGAAALVVYEEDGDEPLSE